MIWKKWSIETTQESHLAHFNRSLDHLGKPLFVVQVQSTWHRGRCSSHSMIIPSCSLQVYTNIWQTLHSRTAWSSVASKTTSPKIRVEDITHNVCPMDCRFNKKNFKRMGSLFPLLRTDKKGGKSYLKYIYCHFEWLIWMSINCIFHLKKHIT